MKIPSTSLLIAGFCALLSASRAGELNHYQPGIFGTRDFFVPAEPGFYYSQIDFTYLSDEFRNGSGDTPSGLTLGSSIDFSGTFNNALSLGFNKTQSSTLSLNFQGSNLDLGATLDRDTS